MVTSELIVSCALPFGGAMVATNLAMPPTPSMMILRSKSAKSL